MAQPMTVDVKVGVQLFETINLKEREANNIFFTSDTHLNHNREFVYKDRGFNSIEEHDKYIIEQWNKTVNDDSIIFFLGDFGLGRDTELIDEYYNMLKGKIIFVRGNHDTDIKVNNIYANITDKRLYSGWGFLLQYGKAYKFYLSHFPTVCWNSSDLPNKQKLINLHGHTHQKEKYTDGQCGLYHIGWDTHKGLVSLQTIIDDLKEKGVYNK